MAVTVGVWVGPEGVGVRVLVRVGVLVKVSVGWVAPQTLIATLPIMVLPPHK